MTLATEVKNKFNELDWVYFTYADAGSKDGACIYVCFTDYKHSKDDETSFGVWLDEDNKVGIRYNAADTYVLCSDVEQVIGIIKTVLKAKGYEGYWTY